MLRPAANQLLIEFRRFFIVQDVKCVRPIGKLARRFWKQFATRATYQRKDVGSKLGDSVEEAYSLASISTALYDTALDLGRCRILFRVGD